jgi:hypothetical protein
MRLHFLLVTIVRQLANYRWKGVLPLPVLPTPPISQCALHYSFRSSLNARFLAAGLDV